MRHFQLITLTVAALVLPAFAPPASARGDERNLRDVLGDDSVASRWIYDDPLAALTMARQQRKPIFALFRCVP